MVDCSQDPWENWSGEIFLRPYRHCQPNDLQDLITLVEEAEQQTPPREVHAYGSGWAFSGPAVTTDYMVNTDRLHRTLDDHEVAHAVIPHALTQEALAGLISQGGDPDDSPKAYNFYHVEAGIKISDLNRRLDDASHRLSTYELQQSHPVLGGRWALPTIGGTGEQSLAGAISTGTHGSDEELKPLADTVQAIHLVGAGAQQHWIEREARITIEEGVKSAYPGIYVHYDNELFNAVLVSVGRMGIIYSMVVRVRRQFGLAVTRTRSTWREISPRLADRSIFAPPGGKTPRSVNIVVNPYPAGSGQRTCYVTTRNEIDVPQRSGGSSLNLFSLICQRRYLVGKVGLGDVIAWIINAVNRVGHPWVSRKLINLLLEMSQSPKSVEGVGYRIIDESRAPTECYRGHSLELYFDATGDAYLRFIEQQLFRVLDEMAEQGMTIGGYISLRFTRRSDAHLAMQRWDRTGAIEVSVLKGVAGAKNLLRRLERAGVASGGAVHWGKQNDLNKAEVERMYPQIDRWRAQLALLTYGGTLATFDNEFARARGLEPLERLN